MPASANHPSPASTFELVWNTLISVLGAPATATMFRRAAKNAAENRPELRALSELDIVREGLSHRFVLPPSWSGPTDEGLEALRYLVREELCPLLEELTGPVVLGMLARQPELVQSGIVAERGDRT